MAFNKKTIKDIDLKDKTVLLRSDFNVPLDSKGKVANDFRIRSAVPTIESLIDQNCKVVIISHLGRPKGKPDKKLSLKPVANHLEKLIEQKVIFVDDCTGKKAQKAVEGAELGDVILLENLRFHAEEKINDDNFAKELAKLAEIFVQDGFGVVHRAHASTDAITKHLPSVAGLLLEREVRNITNATQRPKKPLTTVVGGAKIEGKIELLEHFIKISDNLIIGGAMANTFLKAMGFNIGLSKFSEEETGEANKIIAKCKKTKTKLYLPLDTVAVAKSVDDNARRREIDIRELADDDIILDIGRESLATILNVLKKSGTIIWNGPLGMTELKKFREGSELMAKFLARYHKKDVIVGGGDTAGFIDQMGLVGKFDLVSTGGGASLELLAGKKLPGVEALPDKS